MYEMKDEYLTGIEEIDTQHRKLFEIAEELYQLSKEEFIVDKYDHINKSLQELKDYTNFHFDSEEAYMESIGYKRMFTQKVQHEGLRKQIEEWDLEQIDEENQEETIREILHIVTDWLVNHILEQDKLIGK